MKTGSPSSIEAINLLKPASQLAFFYGCLLSVFQLTFSTSTFHACCFVLTLRWELQVKTGLKAGICFIDAFALPAGGQVPRFLILPVGGQDPFVSLPLFLSRVRGGRRSWLMEALLTSQKVRDRRSRKEDALVNGAWTSNLPNSPLLPSNNGRTTGLEDPSSKADKSWPWMPVAKKCWQRSKFSIIDRSLAVSSARVRLSRINADKYVKYRDIGFTQHY